MAFIEARGIERFQHVIKITSLSTCRHVGVQLELLRIVVWLLVACLHTHRASIKRPRHEIGTR